MNKNNFIPSARQMTRSLPTARLAVMAASIACLSLLATACSTDEDSGTTEHSWAGGEDVARPVGCFSSDGFEC